MKQDRIELRASQKERERLLEAAEFTEMTLSGFLRQAAIEKSNEILRNRDIMTLSNKDRDLFLEALENPPKPNQRLQQAFKNYKTRKNGIRKSSHSGRSVVRSKKTKTASYKIR